MTDERLRAGDAIRVTIDGRTVDAVVILASDNGRAIAVEFDAILAGFVGMAPLLWIDDAGAWQTLTGVPADVRRIE